MKRLSVGLFLLSVWIRAAEVFAGDPMSVKAVIGPAGGEIALQGTRTHVLVQVPPGAVSSDTEFTIEQIAPPSIGQFEKEGTILSDTFRFESHGPMLQKPVSIIFQDLPGGVPPDVELDAAARLYKKSSNGSYLVEKGAVCRDGDGVTEAATVCADPADIAGGEQEAAYIMRSLQSVDTSYSAVSLSVVAVAGDRTVYLPHPEEVAASP